MPAGLEIDSAIGLFHVHAHKDECLFRYATSFIPGAGVTAGEILESLWSTLNSISVTVRTATLAHRAEVLDDHCCDSNHKKGLAIVHYLCRRKTEAQQTYLDAVEYLDGLEAMVDFQVVNEWRAEIMEAERTRLQDIKVMDIYKARIIKSPNLEDTNVGPEAHTAIEQWMDFALTIEEKQYVGRQLAECVSVTNLMYYRPGWPYNIKSADSSGTFGMPTGPQFRNFALH